MSYVIVSLKAAELAGTKKIHPAEAWRRSAEIEFPDSIDSQVKACPKNTFLGLCEEGKIKTVPAGSYTSSQLNKQYALKAIGMLGTGKKFTALELWKAVLKSLNADPEKKHNYQMSVVLALWENDLIVQ